MRPIGMAILVVVAFAGTIRAQTADPKDLVKASLLADVGSIQPGVPFKVGVLLKIAPHWHIYWRNSGDAGIPTVVHLKLPDGFTAAAIQYPVPSRIVLDGNIIMYGYSDEVMLMATIAPPRRIDQPNIAIEASASWLVCDDSCITGEAPSLRILLPIGNQAKPAQRELFEKWNRLLPIDIATVKEIADHKESTVLLSAKNHPNGQWTLTITWKDVPSQIEWFPPASENVVFNNKFTVQTSGNKTTITAGYDRSSTQGKDAANLESVLTYQTAVGRVGVTVPVVLPQQDKSSRP